MRASLWIYGRDCGGPSSGERPSSLGAIVLGLSREAKRRFTCLSRRARDQQSEGTQTPNRSTTGEFVSSNLMVFRAHNHLNYHSNVICFASVAPRSTPDDSHSVWKLLCQPLKFHPSCMHRPRQMSHPMNNKFMHKKSLYLTVTRTSSNEHINMKRGFALPFPSSCPTLN